MAGPDPLLILLYATPFRTGKNTISTYAWPRTESKLDSFWEPFWDPFGQVATLYQGAGGREIDNDPEKEKTAMGTVVGTPPPNWNEILTGDSLGLAGTLVCAEAMQRACIQS